MNHRIALSNKNRPRSLGLSFPIVLWLLLDRLDAHPVVWGIVGTLMVILVAANIYDSYTAKDVELQDLISKAKP